MTTTIALIAGAGLAALSLTFFGFAWLSHLQFKRLMTVFDEDRRNA